MNETNENAIFRAWKDGSYAERQLHGELLLMCLKLILHAGPRTLMLEASPFQRATRRTKKEKYLHVINSIAC